MDGFDAETVPLVKLLNDVLVEHDACLRSLLALFDTTGNRHSSDATTQVRKDTAAQLVRLDADLQRLYAEIEQHQRRQEEIRRVQLLDIACRKARLAFTGGVLDAKSQLEEAAADADKRLSDAATAQNAPPSISEIVEYASKLSKFTSAPPNYDPTNCPVPPEPPYPVLAAMRAGTLNRYRTRKAAKDTEAEDAGADDGDYMHGYEDDQFDDIDTDDLLLGLDLNPDLA
ncbi:hypothetical protein H4R19_003153 [Coemansia spiralis]|nr:hypothetical protein H4R19_003153 [Coemansia spiralis]